MAALRFKRCSARTTSRLSLCDPRLLLHASYPCLLDEGKLLLMCHPMDMPEMIAAAFGDVRRPTVLRIRGRLDG